MDNKTYYVKSGARIKERREALGLTMEALGNALGVNKSTIKRYEDGSTKRITIATYEKLAKTLETSVLYLMGGDDDCYNEINKIETNGKKIKETPAGTIPFGIMFAIPILGEIKAGTPNYAQQDVLGYTYIDKKDYENYFALKVKGDSMDLVNIKDGSVVVVKRQEYIDDGEIGVVLIENQEATVKRVYINDNTVTLMPQSSNPENHPITVDLKKEDFKILGKVVKVEYYL